jgi:hypothetical protein
VLLIDDALAAANLYTAGIPQNAGQSMFAEYQGESETRSTLNPAISPGGNMTAPPEAGGGRTKKPAGGDALFPQAFRSIERSTTPNQTHKQP